MAGQDGEQSRPRVAAEVRAWLIATATLVMQAIGGAWWAATLSEQMANNTKAVDKMEARFASIYTAADAARDLANVRDRLSDHEQRLRAVESKR